VVTASPDATVCRWQSTRTQPGGAAVVARAGRSAVYALGDDQGTDAERTERRWATISVIVMIVLVVTREKKSIVVLGGKIESVVVLFVQRTFFVKLRTVTHDRLPVIASTDNSDDVPRPGSG